MSFDRLLSRIRSQPQATRAALEWMLEAAQDDVDGGEVLGVRLRQIQSWCEASAVSLAQLDLGEWRYLHGSPGRPEAAPEALLAEALDSGEPCARLGWSAAVVDHQPARQLVLAVRRSAGPELLLLVDALAAALGASFELCDRRRRLQARIDRLEACVELASQWSQHRSTESLLRAMAEGATEVFQAERASIFLWDRAARQLVGRPALGVDNGELRVAEDRGVVGRVVQTNQPLLAEEDQADTLIDHRVDSQLRFHTRNVACVPLRNQRGKVIGAFELINKRGGQFTQGDLEGLLELARHAASAIENSQEFERLLSSQKQMADQAAADVQLIGQAPAIVELRESIARIAHTDLAVLVLGENGTGKEVVSRLIHYQSPRRNHPFIAVNCAALAETLLESELFGHQRGAFTDAVEDRPGKFELASGGTLFLDEIGELSPGGQAKLLRVLEEKVVVRVGGSIPIRCDTRVIAATNQNLAELVRQKRFRQDLYFRLNVVALNVPPLRDRGDDVVTLAEFFLETFAVKARRPVPRLTREAKRRLLQHRWPGNVRELRNLMERLAYLSPHDEIDAAELTFGTPLGEPPADDGELRTLSEATRRFQIQYIRRQIERAGGNVTEAARRMGLHRTNLYRKMQQLQMDEAE